MRSSTVDTLPLSTERLEIRRYRLDDRQDYFEIFSNPNIAKYDEFEPIDLPTATENIKEILEWYKTDFHEQSFAVELKTEKKGIGCMYHKIDESGNIYIGYHFNEKYHGKGYAQEAVLAYVYWLLDQTSGNILAVCDAENESSIRLLQKCGFVFAHSDRVISKGQMVTEHVYQFQKPA